MLKNFNHNKILDISSFVTLLRDWHECAFFELVVEPVRVGHDQLDVGNLGVGKIKLLFEKLFPCFFQGLEPTSVLLNLLFVKRDERVFLNLFRHLVNARCSLSCSSFTPCNSWRCGNFDDSLSCWEQLNLCALEQRWQSLDILSWGVTFLVDLSALFASVWVRNRINRLLKLILAAYFIWYAVIKSLDLFHRVHL